jgi:hypothetical protein
LKWIDAVQKRPIIVFFDDKDIVDCAVLDHHLFSVRLLFLQFLCGAGLSEVRLGTFEIFFVDSQRPDISQLSIKRILRGKTAFFKIRFLESNIKITSKGKKRYWV